MVSSLQLYHAASLMASIYRSIILDMYPVPSVSTLLDLVYVYAFRISNPIQSAQKTKRLSIQSTTFIY